MNYLLYGYIREIFRHRFDAISGIETYAEWADYGNDFRVIHLLTNPRQRYNHPRRRMHLSIRWMDEVLPSVQWDFSSTEAALAVNG